MKWLFLAVLVLADGRVIDYGPRTVHRQEDCATLEQTWREALGRGGVEIESMEVWCVPWDTEAEKRPELRT